MILSTAPTPIWLIILGYVIPIGAGVSILINAFWDKEILFKFEKKNRKKMIWLASIMIVLSLVLMISRIVEEIERNKPVAVKDYVHSQKAEINNSLKELMDALEGDFVRIQVSGDNKFVQFHNFEGSLLVSFPAKGLSENEMIVAKKYFTEYGLSGKNLETLDEETGEKMTGYFWLKIFNSDQTDYVTNLGLGALFKIYGIQEKTEFDIIKSWEKIPVFKEEF